MSDFDVSKWWPDHLRRVFAAIVTLMGSPRLYPEDLLSLPQDTGAVIPDHVVKVTHIAGKEMKRRKGRYVITIDGPVFGGQWSFSSGKLERALADEARATQRRERSTDA